MLWSARSFNWEKIPPPKKYVNQLKICNHRYISQLKSWCFFSLIQKRLGQLLDVEWRKHLSPRLDTAFNLRHQNKCQKHPKGCCCLGHSLVCQDLRCLSRLTQWLQREINETNMLSVLTEIHVNLALGCISEHWRHMQISAVYSSTVSRNCKMKAHGSTFTAVTITGAIVDQHPKFGIWTLGHVTCMQISVSSLKFCLNYITWEQAEADER
jgi:hypothetical protein